MLLAALPSAAADPEPQADSKELRARLETLERQIEELRKAQEKGRPADNAKAATATEAKPPETFEVGKDRTLRLTWRNGLQAESADRAFQLHLGGRLHLDAGWWLAPEEIQLGPGGVGPLQDGVSVRRARLRADGTLFEVVDFVLEYGFEGGSARIYDAFLELSHLPYLTALRLGHFKEPFGLEALNSVRTLTFIERSVLLDAFFPFRNVGVMAASTALDEGMTWAAGVFRSNSDPITASDAGDGDYAFTGRLTANPVYDEDGGLALHLGAAYSLRNLPDLDANGRPSASGRGRAAFSSRPEDRVNAPAFVNTGFFLGDTEHLFGAEFALAVGPFQAQAEYVAALVEGAPGRPGTAFFQGFYTQVSYFLTGEHRPYQRRAGTFGVPQPRENFFLVRTGDDGPIRCGRGAWEVAARYSQLDLNNRSVRGGELRDVTLALNWYLNAHVRLSANYILIQRDAPGDGTNGLVHTLLTRMQIDF